ncbi:hypothetical protein [Methylobacterium mesophilicum]|uniref:hypothetical protein n=1 Tax=Methylobacterium mesophilicum TaxID=39956 RepID=UPI002F3587EC
MAYQPGIDRAGLKRHGNASRGRFPEAATPRPLAEAAMPLDPIALVAAAAFAGGRAGIHACAATPTPSCSCAPLWRTVWPPQSDGCSPGGAARSGRPIPAWALVAAAGL